MWTAFVKAFLCAGRMVAGMLRTEVGWSAVHGTQTSFGFLGQVDASCGLDARGHLFWNMIRPCAAHGLQGHWNEENALGDVI